ncbi:uncharacterized protein LOC118434784 [Folsomia candida]|nr:uncharacterized protein LOC118434784 [Folsomia candida]
MEADSDKEKMVIRDIFLRRLATLKHGEKCDSEKQLYLDNPPLAKDSFTWVDPKPKDVQQWQLYLLQDDKPICNYVQFLRCDEKNMLCRCKKEFDPLQDRKRFTPPFSPACVSGAECKAMPLFFMKQCWCPEGKICGNSSSTSTFNPSTIKNLTSTIQKRFTLNLGESCDPEAHSVLLDPKDSEVRDYNLRVSTLQKLIVSRPSVHFCNLDKFLNCSSSKKCECFHQLVEQEGICRSRNLDQCESTFPYGTSLYPSGPQLWKIEQIFQKSFSPQCVKNAGCGNDKMIGKCVCKNGKAGPLCKDPKSVFASVLNPSHIQGYNEDGKINKVFYNLNFFTYKMEELMTLTYGDECNPKFGFMVERIQSFYRDIGSSEDIAKGKTLYQYKKATKWVEYLLKSGVTELCNQFHGLSCHPISKKCYCPSTHEYEDKICKLRPNEECDPNPQASWISVCRKNSHCLPATSTTKSSCQCLEGWSGPDCQTPSRNNGRHTGVETCENNVTMNLNGVIISECLDGLVEFEDNIPLPPEPNLFSDFATMLDRILNHRNLPMDSKCDPDQETQFTKLFPTLPHFKQDDYESLPQGKLLTYSELRRIERNVGAKFCDRKKYLVCNGESGRCDCNLNVYVKEGLKCRLREGKFCGEIGTVYERGVELPLCEKGTKCRKLGFGVHTCVHVATEDEVF